MPCTQRLQAASQDRNTAHHCPIAGVDDHATARACRMSILTILDTVTITMSLFCRRLIINKKNWRKIGQSLRYFSLLERHSTKQQSFEFTIHKPTRHMT